MVFRPSDFNFPRSRGRSGFELRSDKSLLQVGIGPTDVPVENAGRWDLDHQGVLKFYKKDDAAPNQTMTISSVAPDKLVVQR